MDGSFRDCSGAPVGRQDDDQHAPIETREELRERRILC
jgi:hypothetical protein